MRTFIKLLGASALIFSVFVQTAQASVVVAGTRIVFSSEQREATIKVSNEGDSPSLVQTWLDNGEIDASPDTIDVPFTLTPAMFRLDPGKGQTLRMIYSKAPLAQDKETLFWLNVLEIPPKLKMQQDDANQLQMAFRTRIKVFFRPATLEGKAADSPAKVTWQLIRSPGAPGYELKAMNPTPYFVNLGNVELKVAGKRLEAGSGYIKPGESQLFPVKGLNSLPPSDAEVEYNAINDFGAGVRAQAQLKSISQ